MYVKCIIVFAITTAKCAIISSIKIIQIIEIKRICISGVIMDDIKIIGIKGAMSNKMINRIYKL